MIEASLHDNSLLAQLRREIDGELESRIAGLIADPTEKAAGYIQGLQAALAAADAIGRRMNSPQPERK